MTSIKLRKKIKYNQHKRRLKTKNFLVSIGHRSKWKEKQNLVNGGHKQAQANFVGHVQVLWKNIKPPRLAITPKKICSSYNSILFM